MNFYLEQLTEAVAGRFVIHAKRDTQGLSIFCRDLEGNLVTSRVFTAQQLRNAQLVRLVMMDLKRSLLGSQPQLALTPLPESLHPSAS
ncbi:hypothetical protein M1D96_02400 [Pseudomonas sp. D1-3]|uniref:hypothetical protein n=1 Tax=Phytopseudomonas argentinensis TaxID=289370 RepID=UPI0008A96EDD|nr:hypothetical protein [Pseudomonas argentinensis]